MNWYNINLGAILKTKPTNQPSPNKLLLNSNIWNRQIYAKKISSEKSLQPLGYVKELFDIKLMFDWNTWNHLFMCE